MPLILFYEPSEAFFLFITLSMHAFFSNSNQYRLNSIHFGRIPSREDEIVWTPERV